MAILLRLVALCFKWSAATFRACGWAWLEFYEVDIGVRIGRDERLASGTAKKGRNYMITFPTFHSMRSWRGEVGEQDVSFGGLCGGKALSSSRRGL